MPTIMVEEIDKVCLAWTNHASFTSGGIVQYQVTGNCEEMNNVATIIAAMCPFLTSRFIFSAFGETLLTLLLSLYLHCLLDVIQG